MTNGINNLLTDTNMTISTIINSTRYNSELMSRSQNFEQNNLEVGSKYDSLNLQEGEEDYDHLRHPRY